MLCPRRAALLGQFRDFLIGQLKRGQIGQLRPDMHVDADHIQMPAIAPAMA